MGIDFKEKIEKNKIVEFLKRNVTRMNTIKAESIVNALADTQLELLLNDAKYLLDIKGISDKSIGKIKECLNVYVNLKEILEEVKGLEDIEVLIDNIYKAIGSKAVEKIKENPYCVCEYDIDFIIADKIALSFGFKGDDKNRIKQSIMCVINNDIRRNGNLFSYMDVVNKNVLEFINKADTFECEFDNIDSLFDGALNSLIIDGKIVAEEGCIYREDYYFIEKNIVERIKASLKMEGFCKDRDSLSNKEVLQRYKLNEEQEESVFTALTNKISIITGGPGTGKTSTIRALLSVIRAIKPDVEIKISAPTGKAAIKVAKETEHDAVTIHKLLNLSVGDSKKNKVNTINADFLILDETSMIDAYLFCQLLTNTNPKTNIVIIGDFEQLPSVGPGSILKDLINSKKIPVVTLKEVYRQAEGKESSIAKNAHRLIDREIEKEKTEIKFDDKEFVFIEVEEEKIIDTLIENLNSLILEENYPMKDIMFLSTINEGELGIREINKRIQNWYHNEADEEEFRVKKYDRVMQRSNNYKLQVMNGEVGFVDKYVENKDSGDISIKVKFDDRTIEYINENIEQLQVAYCITVHKSQGSEYPVILMPISNKNMYMANVNTLYTGITRAKNKIILIGNKQAFFEAISRRADGKRNSRIVERLNM